MESNEAIEIQLWEYIDNHCDAAEQQHIAGLIASGGIWKQKYDELLAVHQSIHAIEPENTSMRFSKNVMEAIADVKVAKATNSYINPWIVKGIAAFFIMLLGGTIIYGLSNLDWSTTPAPSKESYDYSSLFNSNFIICVVLLNVLLLIIFFDTLFRRKKVQNN